MKREVGSGMKILNTIFIYPGKKESEGACVMYKHAHAFMFERWAAVVVSHVR